MPELDDGSQAARQQRAAHNLLSLRQQQHSETARLMENAEKLSYSASSNEKESNSLFKRTILATKAALRFRKVRSADKSNMKGNTMIDQNTVIESFGSFDSAISVCDRIETVAERLESVNPKMYHRKPKETDIFVVKEIPINGESSLRDMTLRQLYVELNEYVSEKDSKMSKTGSVISDDPLHIQQHNPNNQDLQVRARDLRRLELTTHNQEKPVIVVRRHLVIMAFGEIHVVVLADKILMIVKPGVDELLVTLERHIRDWQPETTVGNIKFSVPFEHYAYETVLATAHALQVQELQTLSRLVTEMLSFMKKGSIFPLVLQERLWECKNKVNRILAKAEGFRDVVEQFMDSDEDMALMNLHALAARPSLYSQPLQPEILAMHEVIEDLLESFLTDFSSFSKEVEDLSMQINAAESLTLLRLDTSRNELLLVDTQLSVLAVCFGVGAFITGLFGMNLDNTNTLQNAPGGFKSVSVLCLVIIVVGYLAIMLYLRITGKLPTKVNAQLNSVSY